MNSNFYMISNITGILKLQILLAILYWKKALSTCRCKGVNIKPGKIYY